MTQWRNDTSLEKGISGMGEVPLIVRNISTTIAFVWEGISSVQEIKKINVRTELLITKILVHSQHKI